MLSVMVIISKQRWKTPVLVSISLGSYLSELRDNKCQVCVCTGNLSDQNKKINDMLLESKTWIYEWFY